MDIVTNILIGYLCVAGMACVGFAIQNLLDQRKWGGLGDLFISLVLCGLLGLAWPAVLIVHMVEATNRHRGPNKR